MVSLESRLTGVFAEKDHHLKVVSCNKIFVELAGFTSDDHVLGLTDYDLCWNKYAKLYALHELDALKGNNYSAVIPSVDHTGRQGLSVHTKVGRKDSRGDIRSIYCRAFEIFNPRWNELTALLSDYSFNDKPCYYIGKTNVFELSKKESEILFYLVHGKRTKTIASILSRSVRTIEHHIENAKRKLGCNTMAELIAFAVAHGFMENLPEDTLKNLINKLKVS